jgi:hypothetical protein
VSGDLRGEEAWDKVPEVDEKTKAQDRNQKNCVAD